MRIKMLLLALLLASIAGLTSPSADAASNQSCSSCTTYPDGSSCCVSCMCDGYGRVLWCTDNFCP